MRWLLLSLALANAAAIASEPKFLAGPDSDKGFGLPARNTLTFYVVAKNAGLFEETATERWRRLNPGKPLSAMYSELLGGRKGVLVDPEPLADPHWYR